MPNLSLFYDRSDQVIDVSAVFLNSNNVATDPASITFILTDPTGAQTTYTYTAGSVDPATNVIIRDQVGNYHINIKPVTPMAGLWNYTWVGSGGSVVNGAQVTVDSFRVFGLDEIAGSQMTYCSVRELKSSLNIAQTETKDDYEMQRAVITATSLVNDLCGQHFYQVTEARTFSYLSIHEMWIDPLVPGTITSFKLDYDGDGVYEKNWVENADYKTLRYSEEYNPRTLGEDRPHDTVQVLLSLPQSGVGGQFLPFVWAWTPKNRVQITATWGWKTVPQNVHHATLLLAVDLFKMKDAPWGIAGMGELGMVRTQANPQITELLLKYRAPRNLVGV